MSRINRKKHNNLDKLIPCANFEYVNYFCNIDNTMNDLIVNRNFQCTRQPIPEYRENGRVCNTYTDHNSHLTREININPHCNVNTNENMYCSRDIGFLENINVDSELKSLNYIYSKTNKNYEPKHLMKMNSCVKEGSYKSVHDMGPKKVCDKFGINECVKYPEPDMKICCIKNKNERKKEFLPIGPRRCEHKCEQVWDNFTRRGCISENFKPPKSTEEVRVLGKDYAKWDCNTCGYKYNCDGTF